MKRAFRFFLICCAAILSQAVPCLAQNNPYELEDSCFVLYRQAERAVGQEDYKEVRDRFFDRCVETADYKGETIAFLLDLKNETSKTDNAERVEKAFAAVCARAKLSGYMQYYYHAFATKAVYYFNNVETRHLAFSTLGQLMDISEQEESEYGKWTAARYLGMFYLSGYDLNYAREHLSKAVRVYENATDPQLKRQSLTRTLCDLADTYSFHDDSLKFFASRALELAKTPSDSAVAYNSLIRYAAINGDRGEYRRIKRIVENNLSWSALKKYTDYTILNTDAIFAGKVKDVIGKILKANIMNRRYYASLLRSLGDYRSSDAISLSMLDDLATSMSSRNTDLIDKLASSMQTVQMSQEILKKTRRINILVSLLAALIVFVLSATIVSLIVHRNQTRKHEKQRDGLIEDLKEANRKALAADEAKTMFVHNMSHEVRTPLNAIVGFSQLLSLPDGTLNDEEKKAYGGYIVNNSRILTMLVDDILSASDMESGKYTVQMESFSCNEICRLSMQSTEYRAPSGVRMYFTSDVEDSVLINTDPRRVQQILINFLTNACKHTRKGEIHLHCSVDAEAGKALFSVADTGCGVPKEDAEKIFDRFIKLNSFAQGTGLGLNICRSISERLGGKVYLDTTYKNGARFVLEIAI